MKMWRLLFGLRWGGSFLVGDTVWWLSNRRCGGSVIEDLVAHGEKSMVDHNWRCVDPLAEMCWLIGRKIWWRIVGFVVWWRCGGSLLAMSFGGDVVAHWQRTRLLRLGIRRLPQCFWDAARSLCNTVAVCPFVNGRKYRSNFCQVIISMT